MKVPPVIEIFLELENKPKDPKWISTRVRRKEWGAYSKGWLHYWSAQVVISSASLTNLVTMHCINISFKYFEVADEAVDPLTEL